MCHCCWNKRRKPWSRRITLPTACVTLQTYSRDLHWPSATSSSTRASLCTYYNCPGTVTTMGLNRGPIGPWVVRDICLIAQAILANVAVELEGTELARWALRLELWGTELFEAVSLDMTFERNQDGLRPVRQRGLRIFVDILGWEGLFRPFATPPGMLR